MDHLWSPWRYRYVSSAGAEEGCLFCRIAAERNDRANRVVLRAARNFIVLNAFPYTSGHVMIVPYAHVASLAEADGADLAEMMSLARRTETALRQAYTPAGLNIGMNIGHA